MSSELLWLATPINWPFIVAAYLILRGLFVMKREDVGYILSLGGVAVGVAALIFFPIVLLWILGVLLGA